jgi:hypothetical protein
VISESQSIRHTPREMLLMLPPTLREIECVLILMLMLMLLLILMLMYICHALKSKMYRKTAVDELMKINFAVAELAGI